MKTQSFVMKDNVVFNFFRLEEHEIIWENILESPSFF